MLHKMSGLDRAVTDLVLRRVSRDKGASVPNLPEEHLFCLTFLYTRHPCEISFGEILFLKNI